MPQQGKPTFEQLLQGAPPAPKPSFEELLAQPSTPAPSFEQLLAQAPQQPQGSYLDRLRHNVGLAASQGYEALKGKAAALGEIAGGIATGDFRPLLEAGESVARGAAPLVGAALNPYNPASA